MEGTSNLLRLAALMATDTFPSLSSRVELNQVESGFAGSDSAYSVSLNNSCPLSDNDTLILSCTRKPERAGVPNLVQEVQLHQLGLDFSASPGCPFVPFAYAKL